MRRLFLYPGEDGYWVAECQSLAGCISQGETREAAIANIREAIAEYVAALEDDGLPVPGESPGRRSLISGGRRHHGRRKRAL